MRTAQIIRQRQPRPSVLVMAGGAFDLAFVDSLLGLIGEQGKLDLVNEVRIDDYPPGLPRREARPDVPLRYKRERQERPTVLV